MAARGPIRLAHVWSHDLGIPAALPFCAPLVERGWEITIICPPGRHTPLVAANGMRFRPLALRRKLHPPSDLVGAAQLLDYYRRDRYDIVHTHAIKVGHMARVLAYAARVPIVVHTLHGLAYSLDDPWLRRTGHALLEKIASLRVDAVLAQAEEDRETVIASGAIPSERVIWIGNGIDLSRFDPTTCTDEDRRAARAELGVGEDEVLFFSAGRLVREKGLVELFEAAARARRQDPRVRLAVAGDLDEEKADALPRELLERARADGVLLLGRRSDMPRLYAACDVVTLVSWREGMPRVLMEGAAMGKPLLAADARGCREIVRPPIHGLLVPPRDPRALADAMCSLAADPTLRHEWGQANSLSAHDRYDIHAVVTRVIAVYDGLLGGQAPTAHPPDTTQDSKGPARFPRGKQNARVHRIHPRNHGVGRREPVPIKRGVDLVGAVLGLTVGAPLLAAIAVAIRLDSKGGALFRQERVGQGGKVYRLVKFRTMHVGAPIEFNADGSTRVASGDARVTRVGKRLRGALDELPQLINVLKGEMSLVGPRPDMPVHAAMYTEAEKGKLAVRPGITSLAAVLGRNEISWRSRIAIDLRYIENWSLALDLEIMAQTLLLPLGIRLFTFDDLIEGVEIKPAGAA